MDFARPNYLYLFILLPVCIGFLIWANRKRAADLARMGSPSLIAGLSSNISRRKREWKYILWVLALIALITSLARPRWGTQVTVRAKQGVEVMVVLDVSSSMLAEDIKPNRLVRAKLTVEELMDRLGGNEIGLVLFSGAAFMQFPLTADFNTARLFLKDAGPESISRPGTALAEALRVALDGFPEERATSKVILLLTDGEGHEGEPLEVAEQAAEQEVAIYAIGFGSPSGEPIPIRDDEGTITGYKEDAQGEPVLSKLDEVTLQQITNAANGYYFRASAGGEEIDTIVEAIEKLETGESEEEGQFETQGVERFAWFTGIALLALTAETLLGERRKDA